MSRELKRKCRTGSFDERGLSDTAHRVPLASPARGDDSLSADYTATEQTWPPSFASVAHSRTIRRVDHPRRRLRAVRQSGRASQGTLHLHLSLPQAWLIAAGAPGGWRLKSHSAALMAAGTAPNLPSRAANRDGAPQPVFIGGGTHRLRSSPVFIGSAPLERERERCGATCRGRASPVFVGSAP